MSYTHTVAQYPIEDGDIMLVEVMQPGTEHADPENRFLVYTVRPGIGDMSH